LLVVKINHAVDRVAAHQSLSSKKAIEPSSKGKASRAAWIEASTREEVTFGSATSIGSRIAFTGDSIDNVDTVWAVIARKKIREERYMGEGRGNVAARCCLGGKEWRWVVLKGGFVWGV